MGRLCSNCHTSTNFEDNGVDGRLVCLECGTIVDGVEFSSATVPSSAEAMSQQWCGHSEGQTAAGHMAMLSGLTTVSGHQVKRNVPQKERTDKRYAAMCRTIGGNLGLSGSLIKEAKDLLLSFRQTPGFMKSMKQVLPACLLYVARNNNFELPMAKLSKESSVTAKHILHYLNKIRKTRAPAEEEESTQALVGLAAFKETGTINMSQVYAGYTNDVLSTLQCFLADRYDNVKNRTESLLKIFENEWQRNPQPLNRVLACVMVACESVSLSYENDIKPRLIKAECVRDVRLRKPMDTYRELLSVLSRIAGEHIPWLASTDGKPVDKKLTMQYFDDILAAYEALNRNVSLTDGSMDTSDLSSNVLARINQQALGTKPLHVPTHMTSSERRRSERIQDLKYSVAEFKVHLASHCQSSSVCTLKATAKADDLQSPTDIVSNMVKFSEGQIRSCLAMAHETDAHCSTAVSSANPASDTGLPVAAPAVAPAASTATCTDEEVQMTLHKRAEGCKCSLAEPVLQVRQWLIQGISEADIYADPECTVNLVDQPSTIPTEFDLREELDNDDIADEELPGFVRSAGEIKAIVGLDQSQAT
ncbi:uncharacterized protein LOC135811566 [Sycon ciliatum]|uniref:uncharacterized protein LOC135811566 n=1 Tax=Sycon ciliatum TaxID=27933 RepID=UPI0031F6B17B